MGVLSGQMREASREKTLRPEEGTEGGWESREGSPQAEGMACVRLRGGTPHADLLRD